MIDYSHTEEYKIAKNQEINYYDKIKNYFNIENLKISENKYDKFDYYNNEYLIEMKTRNNTKDKYPTTIITTNKIKYGLTQNKQMIFLFLFTDGLYFIKYDKDLFNEFEQKNYCSRKRIQYEYNTYTFIDVNKLTKIN
jgi:hypothetical protein